MKKKLSETVSSKESFYSFSDLRFTGDYFHYW